MAWGILIAAVTMFGMFVLAIHEASTYEETLAEYDEATTEHKDLPKAA
jgi:hypothetical protein